jgi:hypothetical protein
MDTRRAIQPSRRRFLKLAGSGLVLIPVVQLYGCSRGEPEPERAAPAETPAETPTPAAPAPAPSPAAAEMTRLSEDDPMAQALGYKHAAADVDTNAFPRYEAGQVCANCNLYQGEEGEEWGGCTIFPGRLVHADGWCNSWIPMA